MYPSPPVLAIWHFGEAGMNCWHQPGNAFEALSEKLPSWGKGSLANPLHPPPPHKKNKCAKKPSRKHESRGDTNWTQLCGCLQITSRPAVAITFVRNCLSWCASILNRCVVARPMALQTGEMVGGAQHTDTQAASSANDCLCALACHVSIGEYHT